MSKDDLSKEAQELKDKLGEGIKKDFIRREFNPLQAIGLKGGIGTVAGYACGAFIKMGSKPLIWYGCIGVGTIAWLHWCSYIKICW